MLSRRSSLTQLILVSITTLLSLPATVSATTFHLQDNFVGDSFKQGFTWETFNDPTGGRVNYVDLPTAQANNLTYTAPGKFVIRGDDQNVVPPGARGRDSVRIVSNNAYTDSVIVFDVQHMPWGCAQWPAFWTLTNQNWPDGGEVDIIEGINLQGQNLASLHTSAGCTMPHNRQQSGTAHTDDCNTAVNHNSGCGSSFNKANNYGSGFNSAGGGWYVITRTNADGMAMYFWSRSDNSVPAEVRNGAPNLTPSPSWGKPEASFPSTQCDFSSHFTPHNIIINLTFCGAWAGPRFSSAGCGSGTCEDYVDNNPQAFQQAYWEINALRVYTP